METLRMRLIRHEGRMRVVYDDATGYPIVRGYTVQGNPTIGVGILVVAPGLTEAEIDFLLDNRIFMVTGQVQKNLPWVSQLNKERQDVLYEMCFQLGINRLMLFRKALKAMEEGRYKDAAKEMKDSAWHRQTPERCEELAKIMETGESI